ncbi:MAG: hypothetical protein QGF34_06815, partial [Candidatus Poseidoniaceae archaeon]|nr:hypothetical protein [Candidatus Poseidoniaceae archaeon]
MLMKQDIEQMESIFAQVGKNNDLSLVPLADSYRSCELQRSIPLPSAPWIRKCQGRTKSDDVSI